MTFVGQRADTERYYAASDVFLLPSWYETFSLAAFEAAASGLPIVAAPVNGVDELVGDGEAGLIVDRDADELAAALAALAGSPDTRERLGAAARERSAEYTWERSTDAVLAVYRSLLAPRAGGVEGGGAGVTAAVALARGGGRALVGLGIAAIALVAVVYTASQPSQLRTAVTIALVLLATAVGLVWPERLLYGVVVWLVALGFVRRVLTLVGAAARARPAAPGRTRGRRAAPRRHRRSGAPAADGAVAERRRDVAA